MNVVCAYCKIKYGEKEGEGISHGICPSCFEIEMKKIINIKCQDTKGMITENKDKRFSPSIYISVKK